MEFIPQTSNILLELQIKIEIDSSWVMGASIAFETTREIEVKKIMRNKAIGICFLFGLTSALSSHKYF